MNNQPITKAEAIAAYEGNAAALARAFGITPSAIYQWPEGPIAEGYALKLRYVLKPELFGVEGGGNLARRTTAAPEGGDAAQADGVSVQPVSEAA